MVNRPAGGDRSKKWERAQFDWYIEPPAAVEQLLARMDFGDDLIWDPCCGRGGVLDVAKRWGHRTVGSDVVDRHPRHQFFRANVLRQVKRAPRVEGRETSIICNPPYSYEQDIAERIITRVLEAFDVRRAAFILPIAFLASQDRWSSNRLLRWQPSHVCFYRDRHTMPPGHLIEQMAKPFEGGMADYVALVFTRPHRWRAPAAIWLPPGRHQPRPKAQSKGSASA